MLRLIIILMYAVLLVCSDSLLFAQKFHQPASPRTQLLFTDPFEDSDDLFAILSFINEAIHSKDQFYLVTANEIVDEQGRGLRAMALYQFIHQLVSDTDPSLNRQNRQKLLEALNQGRLQIIQGQVSQPFQQSYNQFLVTGTGDTHFYNPGLIKSFYQSDYKLQRFKTIHQLRDLLLSEEEHRRLTILGIASSNDIAILFLDDPLLVRDDFTGQGTPEQQINQARQYYQNKQHELMLKHYSLTSAQMLAARVDLFWQMSGGLNHQEEYNEKQSRVASDYLNHIFSAAHHGITPINTTSLLHPVGEFLKEEQIDPWPVDEQWMLIKPVADALKENLVGQGVDGIHSFAYPGYFNKTHNHLPIKSLNHDTLALVESSSRNKKFLLCHLDYSFNQSKNKISRSYDCRSGSEPSGQEFSVAVSSLTDKLYRHNTNDPEAAEILNQKTDARVMDVLFHLFSLPYNRLGIFDFDCTITVDESFKHPTDDPVVVRNNTKLHISSIMRKHGAIFAINSFIDSPENILIYLHSIFKHQPKLIRQQEYYLPNKKRGKNVLAFYLSEYRISHFPVPVYITTLPERSGEVDPETGEKNVAYHMAIEALEGTGKNIPSSAIARHLLEGGYLSSMTQSAFYDDNRENAQYASGFMLLDHPMKSFVVTPHIKHFEAMELE